MKLILSTFLILLSTQAHAGGGLCQDCEVVYKCINPQAPTLFEIEVVGFKEGQESTGAIGSMDWNKGQSTFVYNKIRDFDRYYLNNNLVLNGKFEPFNGIPAQYESVTIFLPKKNPYHVKHAVGYVTHGTVNETVSCDGSGFREASSIEPSEE